MRTGSAGLEPRNSCAVSGFAFISSSVHFV